jgi:hypothetical protein
MTGTKWPGTKWKGTNRRVTNLNVLRPKHVWSTKLKPQRLSVSTALQRWFAAYDRVDRVIREAPLMHGAGTCPIQKTHFWLLQSRCTAHCKLGTVFMQSLVYLVLGRGGRKAGKCGYTRTFKIWTLVPMVSAIVGRGSEIRGGAPFQPKKWYPPYPFKNYLTK